MEFAVVLVAAGASTRMGFPKLWGDVCGRPLIAHAIDAACTACPTELIVVVSADRIAETLALAPGAQVIPGGARRRDSVAAGLAASSAPWLAIHDAARMPGKLAGIALAKRSGSIPSGITDVGWLRRPLARRMGTTSWFGACAPSAYFSIMRSIQRYGRRHWRWTLTAE